MVIWDIIGVTVLGFLGVILANFFLQGLGGMGKTVVFAIAVALAWQGVNSDTIHPGSFIRDTIFRPVLGSRPAVDRVTEEYENRLLKDPTIGPELTKVGMLGRREKLFALTSRGMQRLGPDYHAKRIVLINRLLQQASERDCAQLGRGQLKAESLRQMLGKLSDQEIAEFYSLVMAAAQAEIRQTPYSRASEYEIARALQAFLTQLPEREAARFQNIATSPYLSSDADVCWMGKLLYQRVDRVSEPERGVLRQMLSRWE